MRYDAHRRERRKPGSQCRQNSLFHTDVPLPMSMCPSGSNLIPYRPAHRPLETRIRRLLLSPWANFYPPLAVLAEGLKRF